MLMMVYTSLLDLDLSAVSLSWSHIYLSGISGYVTAPMLCDLAYNQS